MRLGTIAVAATVAAAALATNALTPSTADASPRPGPGWSASWTSATQRPVAGSDATGPNWSMDGFTNQTIRETVRLSGGGGSVRIRLSNAYGDHPLVITGATIARTSTGAAVQPGTVRPLTFDGRRSTTIAAGHLKASDAAALHVTPLESLTVTLYLAGATGPATFHEDGLTTTYRAGGDHRSDIGGAAFNGGTSHSFYYLSGVDVAAGGSRGTVVAFGDSITNGHNSTPGGDARYTDGLADRLTSAHRELDVANVGISGNLLLSELPCFGGSGVDRFRRDALDQPGVRTVILLEGENDIWDSEGNFGCGVTSRVTADELIAGYESLIAAAHVRGVRVVGVTITPFKAPYIAPADFARAEAIRVRVNDWVRTSGAYDGVADFAGAVADPDDPQQLSPAYNSGDFLHPNDTGYAALAAAINLRDL
jgi:lysophospholipase L1-like esterase